MALKPVEILITAKDKASEVFGGLKATAISAGIAIAGYFGIRAFSGAVQGAAELEAKLSEVKAVSGATAAEMQLLQKAAEEAGATTKFSAAEGADALGNLARSGLSAQEAIAALPATLALAAAGGLGLSDSSALVTKVLAGFGYEATEAGRVADVLAMGANASNTSVQGLGEALSYAAPTAVAMGMSLESVVGIVGKFADAGIDAGRAGTALNAILAQFSDPASKFRNELAAVGITTTDFEKALRQLEAAGPAGQKAIAAVGLEAGPALKALLNQGIGSLDELKAKLLEAQGAAQSTADTMSNNLNGATAGLASVWDTVKNALATPVLPVLKDGVDQLTAALRGAVQDGTVGKFGTAIASGFQSALTWARSFLAEVDFAALSQRVSTAADQVGAAFVTLETYAKNTGNAVALAWGVMSAGANAVLAVVYGLGSAFSKVAETVMAGLAVMRDGLAGISFGGLSRGFKEAADDARLSAGGFGAAAEALAQKAEQALASMADGAQTARTAWSGLTEASGNASAQASAGAQVFEQVGETLKEVGGDATAMGQKAQAAAVLQTEAARQTREAVATLKREYEAALQAGDVQTAVGKLQQMQAALQQTGNAAKATGQEVAAAFQRMGVQSKAELASAAQNAKRDFELIKASGEATADGLQAAFKKYAEAAIAANGGVATEALKSEAAMRGLEVVTDSAGKAIVRAMGTGQQATGEFNKSLDESKGKVQEVIGWLDRLEKRNAAVKSNLVTDSDKFAVDGKGTRITQQVENRQSVATRLQGMGVDEAKAQQLAASLYNAQGAYTPRSSGVFRSDTDTLDVLIQRLAAQYSGKNGAAAVGRSVTVNINTPNGRETVTTDEQGAQALVRTLRSAGLASRG